MKVIHQLQTRFIIIIAEFLFISFCFILRFYPSSNDQSCADDIENGMSAKEKGSNFQIQEAVLRRRQYTPKD